MKTSLLLRYQIGYMLLGITYNVISIIMKVYSGRQLSFTSPITGTVAMLIFGLFLIPGFLHYYKTYRILMGIAIIVFGYAGIIVHVLNYSRPHLYYSAVAWVVAIAINVFGIILNLIAASGKVQNS